LDRFLRRGFEPSPPMALGCGTELCGKLGDDGVR
jgi:hypothetical protein